MTRRPLLALLATGLLTVAPAGAGAASVNELLAQGEGNSLRSTPPTDGLTAQSSSDGSLSDTPPKVSGSGSPAAGSGNAVTKPAAASAALPYTGSDPRITLMLGVAALLAGAGLRLRSGDARDF